jgi:hypothetical protein
LVSIWMKLPTVKASRVCPEFWGLADESGRLHLIADITTTSANSGSGSSGKMEFHPTVRSVELESTT